MNAACDWLVHNPWIACLVICSVCIVAGRLDLVLP
ncbi:hypothetical protein MesloDRAFT_1171 [Mesorhizobium japonicum R7A]|nr:hypothetical protein MesloDRAFT_1171 [Mesorhizobium japonicum R7A]